MNFSIEQREVELESTFSPRLWALVHDVPVLYEALLERLAHTGLSGMAARKLVDAIPSDRFPESLRRLRVVLAEPVVRRRLPARAKRSGDIDWLRSNARSYSGKWVALADGELIAADESLAALRRRLRELAPKIKPLLHRL
ncbi:MAG: DUF5678 domain-containing protein [Acidobacteria bacterium]|nr:DUF5678 domain-containing protein [Acidobacteriota bacterium]